MQPTTTDAFGCAENLAAMTDAALLSAVRRYLRGEGFAPSYADLLLAEVSRRLMSRKEGDDATRND